MARWVQYNGSLMKMKEIGFDEDMKKLLNTSLNIKSIGIWFSWNSNLGML